MHISAKILLRMKMNFQSCITKVSLETLSFYIALLNNEIAKNISTGFLYSNLGDMPNSFFVTQDISTSLLVYERSINQPITTKKIPYKF